MSSDTPRRALIEFLTQHGAGALGHSKHNLLDHLVGTWRLLVAWNVPEAVSNAGLFHSVYGTESYTQEMIPAELRPEVRALIGAEGERLAHLFGVMERRSFYANLDSADQTLWSIRHRHDGTTLLLTDRTFPHLCDLTVANWLEQRPRVAEQHQMLRRDEFLKMREHLSPKACAVLTEAYGF